MCVVGIHLWSFCTIFPLTGKHSSSLKIRTCMKQGIIPHCCHHCLIVTSSSDQKLLLTIHLTNHKDPKKNPKSLQLQSHGMVKKNPKNTNIKVVMNIKRNKFIGENSTITIHKSTSLCEDTQNSLKLLWQDAL